MSHLMVSNCLPNQIRNGFKSSYQNKLRNSIEMLKKACWICNESTRKLFLKQTSKIVSCDARGQKRHIGSERKQNQRVTTLRGGSLALHGWFSSLTPLQSFPLYAGDGFVHVRLRT